MKIIIIKTQEELDALPKKFEEFTAIEIRSSELISVKVNYTNATVTASGSSRVSAYGSSISAYDSSRVNAHDSSTVNAHDSSTVYASGSSTVYAYGSSTVYAYGSSRVNAYDSSRVNAYLLSCVTVRSLNVAIGSLLDNSRLVYKTTNCKRPEKQDATAIITEYSDIITPTFEQWIERGIVYADGIFQNLKSQKTIGSVTIYEVEDKDGDSFVARIGDRFAHGKTIEQAKNDLRYKLSDRDTSKFKNWKLEDIKPIDEIIEAYMAVTGACSMGTKMFCESTKLKNEYTIKEIIKLTEGKYGNEVFAKFFKG